MIKLTTSCGKSDTLLTAFMLSIFLSPAIVFGQLDESANAKNETEAEVSVLELSDETTNDSTGLSEMLQRNVLESEPTSILWFEIFRLAVEKKDRCWLRFQHLRHGHIRKK